MNSRIQIAVLGAGGRGRGFGTLLKDFCPEAAICAVAELRDDYRADFAREHGLAPGQAFKSWQEYASSGARPDAVIVATLDRDHVEPAVTFLERGCHLFLEKPMATSLQDCQRIAQAQHKSGVITAVCHSLRYHKGFAKTRELVASGRLGRLVTLDQLEQVAWWHQAHSFVRGNWGNESRSTFMLMAKSCHDIDYLAHLVGRPCLRVSSFGSLSHFRKEHAPPGSTERCTDPCPLEPDCPYSALKQYVFTKRNVWPAEMVCLDHSAQAHLEALRTSPYGRCVWRCDNDAVDHQVVALEFEGGITATFTMTAFTQQGGRRIRVHGTEAELLFDEGRLVLRRFADGNVERLEFGPEPGGHGGGDRRALTAWLRAIREQNPAHVLTDVHESLRTHAIVFAAEESRRTGKTIELGNVPQR